MALTSSLEGYFIVRGVVKDMIDGFPVSLVRDAWMMILLMSLRGLNTDHPLYYMTEALSSLRAVTFILHFVTRWVTCLFFIGRTRCCTTGLRRCFGD